MYKKILTLVLCAFFVLTGCSSKTEVQCGQRVALMLISLWQYGQIFVVGSAGSSSFFVSPTSLLIPFIRQKRINAMIIKFTTDARNEDANPATSDKEYVAPPVRTFRIGFMKLSVSDVTIPEKAPPTKQRQQRQPQ